MQFLVLYQNCLLLGSQMAQLVCGMQRIPFFFARFSLKLLSTLSFLSDLVINEKRVNAKKLAHHWPVCEYFQLIL